MMNKIRQRYHNMSKPLKASMWFMISSIINKGIAFLTTPLFTRLLTTEEFGIVGLYSTWVVLLTIVFTFELATGVFNKAMIKFEDDKDGYTSSTLTLITILVLFFTLIYFLFRSNVNRIIRLPSVIILFMFVEIISTTTWDLFAIRQRFEYRYKEVVIVTILVNLLSTVLSYVLVRLIPAHRPEARIAGLAITHAAVYSVFYVRILHQGKVFFNKRYWKYALLYNLPLIPHYLSQQVLSQSDRIMIEDICGKEAVGIYTLAYTVAVVTQIVTNAVHVTFMPWCFQSMRDNKIKQIGKRAFQIEMLVGAVCLTFSLFAPECIHILGGEAYSSGIYIIPPVSMSIVFITIYTFFGNIEFYFERTKGVMIASVIVAASNVALNWIFIPIYGFVAAGYTTLFCYIFFSAAHYCYMRHICSQNGTEIPFDGIKMWTVAIVLAVLSIAVSAIYHYTVLRYILIFVLLGIILFIVYKKRSILFSSIKRMS